MFKSVNARTDGQTNARMEGRQLESHPLSSPRAFGSGELKSEEHIVTTSVRLFARLSVRPLCYLLLNHWKKFNQIWCVS